MTFLPYVMPNATASAPSVNALRDLEPLSRLTAQLEDPAVQRAFDAGVVGVSADGLYRIKATCRVCRQSIYLPCEELSLMALRLASAIAHDDCLAPD